MTTPLSETAGITASSHMGRDMTQQQQVQRALQQIPAAPTDTRQPNMEDLVKPVEQINETLKPFGVQFELQMDKSRVITRLVDHDTGDVIRQIPSEEVLQVADRLHELQGLLISAEA